MRKIWADVGDGKTSVSSIVKGWLKPLGVLRG